MRNNRTLLDLFIILIWISVGCISIVLFEKNIIRTIFGMSMVLFFPGYILTLVLYPKKKDLEIIERIAISLGLSIVVISILGLVLNFTVGIRLTWIFISIIIYSISFTILAFYRRIKLNEYEIFYVDFIGFIGHIKNKNSYDIFTVVLIITVLITITFIFYVITTPKIGERFTEFYILGNSEKLDDYNRTLEIGRTNNYLVGISNHEYVSVNYTIKVSLDNNVLTTKEIMIENNDRWENNIEIIPTKEGKKLEFLLYKESNLTTPYRRLNLWVK